jgi:hypothetical protein
MLFAATPAAADPLPISSVEGDHEWHAATRKALEDKTYGETDGVRYTFCAAFTRGLTLGVSEILLRHLDDGFPVLRDASKINPRASAAGTALGFLVLVLFVMTFVYPRLARALRRRRTRAMWKTLADAYRDRAASHERAVSHERVEFDERVELDEPVEHETIIGSFVTRDGYEFVVTRGPRKLDN